MSQYKVITAVRPRSAPTVTTSDTGANISVGTILNSNISQVDAITSSHPTMIQILDGVYSGKWIPIVYNSVTYAILIIPPSPGINFTLSVDGFQTFSGTLIPLS